MIVNVHKAIGNPDRPIPSITIRIADEFPSAKTPEASQMAHERNADVLFQVLLATLPGGTLDQLTAKLLNHKASSLIVPYHPTEKAS